VKTTYTIIAPKNPGDEPTTVATRPTIAEARDVAANYAHRRDLTHQDVVIYRGARRVEFAGPFR